MYMYLARVGLYRPTAEVLGSLIFQCVTALHNTRKCLPEAASEGSESGQLSEIKQMNTCFHVDLTNEREITILR
jgi:hypothetical protein